MFIHLLRSWENTLEERGLRTKTWSWFDGDLIKVTKAGCTTNTGVHLGVGLVGTISKVTSDWIRVEFRGYDAPVYIGEKIHKSFKLVRRKALRPKGPPPDRNDSRAQEARLVFPKLDQAVPSWNDSPADSVAEAELDGGSSQGSSTDASSCDGSETEGSDTSESDLIITSGGSDASSVASSEMPDLVPITARPTNHYPATVMMSEPPCYGQVNLQYPTSPVRPSYIEGVWYQDSVTGDLWGVFQGVMYQKKLYSTNNPHPEKRIDNANGRAYTKASFINYYGGTAEWEKAKAATGPSNRGWCNNASVWTPPPI